MRKCGKAATSTLAVASLVVATALSGCGGGGSGRGLPTAGTFYGPTSPLGNGTARSFVKVGPAGNPTAVGVVFTEKALELAGLPRTNREFLLPLPSQGLTTPFTHVTLDWNPAGHPPPGVYTLPHFDVHFYMLTPAERAAITGASGAETPAPQFIPTDYVSIPGVVPTQGVHWFDPTSPEFQPGGTFTRTFIYGFYKGKMNFMEPMVTRDFLLTKPNVSVPLKLPAAYPKPGRYPTRYSITYDAGTKAYTIALDAMVRRD